MWNFCQSCTSIIPVRLRDRTGTKSFPCSCILRRFAQCSSSPTGSLSTQPATNKRDVGNSNNSLRKIIIRRDAIPVRSSKAYATYSHQPVANAATPQTFARAHYNSCSFSPPPLFTPACARQLVFTSIPRWTTRPRDEHSKNPSQNATATTSTSHA